MDIEKIENYVTAAEKIKTKFELNEFFTHLSSSEQYGWSALLIFKPQIIGSGSVSQISNQASKADIVGRVPPNLELLIEQSDQLRSYCFGNNRPRLLPIIDKSVLLKSYHNVLVIPIKRMIRGFGCILLDLSRYDQTKPSPEAEKVGWFCAIIASYLYDAYIRIAVEVQLPFSKRELESIRWASQGKTSWEIGQILSITESTVNFHLANCIEKTQSANRQQAIVRCLLQGHLLH